MKKNIPTIYLMIIFFTISLISTVNAQVYNDSTDVELEEENPPWIKIGKKNRLKVFPGKIVRFKGKGLLLFHSKKRVFVFPKVAKIYIDNKELKPVSYAFEGQGIKINGKRNEWEVKHSTQTEFNNFKGQQKVVFDKQKKHYTLNSEGNKEIVFYINHKENGETIFVHN